jgi:hypothetical protein
MRAHTYTHTHTHTCAHIHTSTHTYIHTRTHAHTHTHICTHAHTDTHTHTHMHTQIHAYTHTHTQIHTRTHTHTHTLTCTHTRTHARYTHTHNFCPVPKIVNPVGLATQTVPVASQHPNLGHHVRLIMFGPIKNSWDLCFFANQGLKIPGVAVHIPPVSLPRHIVAYFLNLTSGINNV